MTRERFHDALQRIELDLLGLGELAADAVARAIRAIEERDALLAQAVIDEDDRIDHAYITIEQDVLGLLALQSPVAADLRLVSAILHSCLHLERVGDQAVNVAKLYLATTAFPGSEAMRVQLREMGDRVVEMLRVAMSAFAQRSVDLANRLPAMDDLVDRLNRASHLEALKLADDPAALDWGMHMNMAARALERVGDNAVDIGEQVAFLVTGEFREFTDASHEVTAP
jgi:phosphate transport system protein